MNSAVSSPNRVVLTVDEAHLPMTLTAPGLTDAEFQAFCDQYPDYRLESTVEGDVVIMPPTDPETGDRNAEITAQLKTWSRGRNGLTPDSSAGFKLPTGARRSPDAAWISRGRLRTRGCPEFVIELLSPSDRVRVVQEKMQEWIDNGVELGWLINPRNQSVTIYRPGQEPMTLSSVMEIEGEGPVAGFVLDLRPVWRTYQADD